MQLNIRREAIIHRVARLAQEELGYKVVEPIGDKIGIYAYLMENKHMRVILVSKRHGKGETISVRTQLLERADRENIPILMCLYGDNERTIKRWYWVNIRAALLNGYPNEFNGQLMTNFSIRLCRRYEDPEDDESEPNKYTKEADQLSLFGTDEH